MEATRLYDTTEKTKAHVERELGITPYLLSKWVRPFRHEQGQAFPGKGKPSERDEELHTRLEAERDQRADPEDPDEHLAQNISWVPPEARWSQPQGNARLPTSGPAPCDGVPSFGC